MGYAIKELSSDLTIEVTYKIVDASFSHEHGIENQKDYKITKIVLTISVGGIPMTVNLVNEFDLGIVDKIANQMVQKELEKMSEKF